MRSGLGEFVVDSLLVDFGGGDDLVDVDSDDFFEDFEGVSLGGEDTLDEVSSFSVGGDGGGELFVEVISSSFAFIEGGFVDFEEGFEVSDVADPKVDVDTEDLVFVFNLVLVFNEGLNGVEFDGLEGSVFGSKGGDEFFDVTEEFSDEVVEVSGVNGVGVDVEGTLVVIDVTGSDVRSGVNVVVKVVFTDVLLEHGQHVMLGDQGEHVSLVVGHVVSEFNEGTVVTVEVGLESGVGDGCLEEFEESGGVLVGLEFLDEEEVGGTSGFESAGKGVNVGLDLVFSLANVISVSGDFIFNVVDGGRDFSAVLVLSSIEVLETGDVVQSTVLFNSPVVHDSLDVRTDGSVHGDQELDDGVNGVTSLDEGLQVEVYLTLGGQSEESEG